MKKPWMNQPLPPNIGTHDVQIIIKVNTTTGQMLIESGNGRPINPYQLCIICTDVIKGNINAIMQQQSMLIRPPAATPPSEPFVGLHDFLPSEEYENKLCKSCGRPPEHEIHNKQVVS